MGWKISSHSKDVERREECISGGCVQWGSHLCVYLCMCTYYQKVYTRMFKVANRLSTVECMLTCGIFSQWNTIQPQEWIIHKYYNNMNESHKHNIRGKIWKIWIWKSSCDHALMTFKINLCPDLLTAVSLGWEWGWEKGFPRCWWHSGSRRHKCVHLMKLHQPVHLLLGNIGLTKKFVQVFCTILQKNPNKLFGHFM